jgi:selenocysteine lyase/cysteine desulfurase
MTPVDGNQISRRRLQLLGLGSPVPVASGDMVTYTNLDYAASTPPLEEVAAAVDRVAVWYSSVHRGAGQKSRVATAMYEGARGAVGAFVNARPSDAVIFTRNTTDALNLLARSVPDRTPIVMFAAEHHANLLPWRRGYAECLPVPRSSADVVAALDSVLGKSRPGLVAVTGASNVTGELWPIAEIAKLAHGRHWRIAVDAAQLAPHHPIDMTALDIDYLAFSGHKVYAPYGAGALVGRPDWLAQADPFLSGGGAVDFVTAEDVIWSKLPGRHEAGSPNVIGAVALGVACDTLAASGMPNIHADELSLAEYARAKLATVSGLTLYTTWPASHPRLGIFAFNLAGYDHALLALVLSAEYGIGVRDGRFCAHPLMLDLLEVDGRATDAMLTELRGGAQPSLPGAVRASLGLGSSRQDIDRLVLALAEISEDGPRCHYDVDPRSGDLRPTPDNRQWPDLGVRMAAESL